MSRVSDQARVFPFLNVSLPYYLRNVANNQHIHPGIHHRTYLTEEDNAP